MHACIFYALSVYFFNVLLLVMCFGWCRTKKYIIIIIIIMIIIITNTKKTV